MQMPMIQVAFTNTQNLNSNADHHERPPPHNTYHQCSSTFRLRFPPSTDRASNRAEECDPTRMLHSARAAKTRKNNDKRKEHPERSACIAYRPEAAGRVYKLMHLPNRKLPPQPAYILRLVPASASSLTPCPLMPFSTAEGTRQAQRRF